MGLLYARRKGSERGEEEKESKGDRVDQTNLLESVNSSPLARPLCGGFSNTSIQCYGAPKQILTQIV